MSIFKLKKKIPRIYWIISIIVVAVAALITISILVYFRIMASTSRKQMDLSDDKSIVRALKYSSDNADFLLELASGLSDNEDTYRSSIVLLYLIQNVQPENDSAYLLLAENYKKTKAEKIMIKQIYDWGIENTQSAEIETAKSEFLASEYSGAQVENDFEPVNNNGFLIADNGRIKLNKKNITALNAFLITGNEKILVAAGTKNNPGIYAICFDGYIYAHISNIEVTRMQACKTGVYVIDSKDNMLKLLRFDAGGIKVIDLGQISEFVLTGSGVCYIDADGVLVLDNGKQADLGDGNTAANLGFENGRPIFNVYDSSFNNIGRFSANDDGEIISEPLMADDT